jgi:hypothetical protein
LPACWPKCIRRDCKPDGRETEPLTLAEGLENRRAELEQSIAADGVRVKLEGGRVLLNPAVVEARQTQPRWPACSPECRWTAHR